jgi:hypothetical protein
MVNGKKYSYSPKGMAMANKAAAKSGKIVMRKPKTRTKKK